MQTTTNYGLRKPDADEFYIVEDQNTNMDVIDEKLKEIDDEKLSKAGGVLSGELDFKFNDTRRARVYTDGNAHFALDENGDGQSQTNIAIISKGQGELNQRLALLDVENGETVGYYKIYGEHNKPTATDVGALPTSGGVVSGSLMTKDIFVCKMNQNDAEGGYIIIESPFTSELDGDVTIRSYGRGLKFFENNGSYVGAELDMTECTPNIGSKLLHTGNIGKYALPLTGGIMKKQTEPNYGGYITLEKATNSTLGENVMIQTFMNQLRVFVSDTEAKGAYLDINECAKSIGSKLLHTGNSAPTIISATAPADTSVVWVDSTAMKIKIYKNGAWTALS